jgi:hypothetical protein
LASAFNLDSYSEFIDYFIDNDSCKIKYCPLEYNSFTYDSSINTLFFDDFNDFGIYVYYDELKYTLISQQPKIKLFGFISNLSDY